MGNKKVERPSRNSKNRDELFRKYQTKTEKSNERTWRYVFGSVSHWNLFSINFSVCSSACAENSQVNRAVSEIRSLVWVDAGDIWITRGYYPDKCFKCCSCGRFCLCLLVMWEVINCSDDHYRQERCGDCQWNDFHQTVPTNGYWEYHHVRT